MHNKKKKKLICIIAIYSYGQLSYEKKCICLKCNLCKNRLPCQPLGLFCFADLATLSVAQHNKNVHGKLEPFVWGNLSRNISNCVDCYWNNCKNLQTKVNVPLRNHFNSLGTALQHPGKHLLYHHVSSRIPFAFSSVTQVINFILYFIHSSSWNFE